MIQIFMSNTLNLLKDKVKHYVKIYYKRGSITVEIVNHETGHVFTYKLNNVEVQLSQGLTSNYFAYNVLQEYKSYVLKLFFNDKY